MYLFNRNWYVAKIITAVADEVAADDPITLDTIVTSRPRKSDIRQPIFDSD